MDGSELSDAGTRGVFDALVRAYVARHPEATVVALGEGLGTAFWRLDNGRLNWLTVQPPEIAAVRRMLLPDGPRRRTVARAVTDHGWLDAVRDPDLGVVVTAPGVLMRLSPAAVRALLAACAERFPDGALVFDAPPRLKGVGGAPIRWVTAVARRGAALSGGRAPGPLRWGLDRAQLPRVAGAHPGIVAVREVPVQRGRFGRFPAPLVCEVRFADARSLRRASSAPT
ncbi:class I SAM-dependent methyltransferase [Streptomyces sp. NPDC048483]|uniref:class I SAM-dependent methyltransferase n=1 Tax=Streptomyces sp. NPDC048483 TaxID=3154927 RepID=UPI003423F6A4